MKLVKILSDSIQIRTNLAEFRDIRINDLLAVSDGYVELVTMVAGLTDTDTEERIGEHDFLGEVTGIKTIECSIIGSLRNGRFVKALDEYPTTSVEIRKIGQHEFSNMLAAHISECFLIGKYAAYDCCAWVNGNKFFQRHACIVGNTGSGKSETVAKILEETAKLPGANIVVFDIHGEYSQLSYASNIKIGVEFPFPVWMFGFNDIVTNILKIREESATTVMTALRRAYYRVCPEGKENKPVYFEYEALVGVLEAMDNELVHTGEYYKTGDKAGMAKTTKGEYSGKLTSTVNLLKDRMMDSRYSFLFHECLQSYLYMVVEAILGTNKPVKNIDLSGVPHDVALPIIGVISRLIFDIQRLQDMDHIRPVTIVCDEAHVYIPDNFQLTASQRRMVEVFEDIAKEGRKFGITLFPATQRPSELTEAVIEAEFTEIKEPEEYTVEYFLKEQNQKLKEMLNGLKDVEPEKVPHKLVERQKMIVCALAAMKADLDMEEFKRTYKPEQPELPILKNNDQRAAFVDAYETWPFWIHTEQTGEKYYRYNLPDGTSMVVKVYHAMIFDHSIDAKKWEERYREGYGRQEYYLLQEGKFFRDCETNRSMLIEKLKEIQKKESKNEEV